jgi:hypothetical protein
VVPYTRKYPKEKGQVIINGEISTATRAGEILGLHQGTVLRLLRDGEIIRGDLRICLDGVPFNRPYLDERDGYTRIRMAYRGREAILRQSKDKAGQLELFQEIMVDYKNHPLVLDTLRRLGYSEGEGAKGDV